jgi:hypothetical protein
MNTTTELANTTVTSTMDKLKTAGNSLASYLSTIKDNKYARAILGMILVLYAAKAAPKLPNYLVKIFDNPIFKILFMFLIGYLVLREPAKPSVALITAIVLFLTIQVLSYFESSVSMKPVVTPLPPATNELNMSPEQNAIINDLLNKINNNKQQAAKAEAFGNIELANTYKIEAFASEMIVEAAVASAQHQKAAVDANNNGDMVSANAHMEEAIKLGEKADLLLHAETAKENAKEAENNGNNEEAKSFLSQAYNYLTKAQKTDEIVPDGKSADNKLASIDSLATELGCLPNLPTDQMQSELLSGYDGRDFAQF